MLETALDAGVSPETLRKIESGRVATPSFPTIAAIAAVLGLSLDEVWAEISQADGIPHVAARAPRRSPDADRGASLLVGADLGVGYPGTVIDDRVHERGIR